VVCGVWAGGTRSGGAGGGEGGDRGSVCVCMCVCVCVKCRAWEGMGPKEGVGNKGVVREGEAWRVGRMY